MFPMVLPVKFPKKKMQTKLIEICVAGQAHFLKIEKILFQGKSEYQSMMVFQVINDISEDDWCLLVYSAV